MVRELGLERRETVRFLSTVGVKENCEEPPLVREDLVGPTYGVPGVMPIGQPRAAKLVWKNCPPGNPSLYKFSDEVCEQNFDRREV